VIDVGSGIDHIPDRSRSDPFDRGDHAVRFRCRTRNHDYYAIVAHLNGNVRTSAHNHVEVRPQPEDLEAVGIPTALYARSTGDVNGKEQSCRDCDTSANAKYHRGRC